MVELGCHWRSADGLSRLPTRSSETHRDPYESQTWMTQSSITNCSGNAISLLAGFSGAIKPNFFVGTNSVRRPVELMSKARKHPP